MFDYFINLNGLFVQIIYKNKLKTKIVLQNSKWIFGRIYYRYGFNLEASEPKWVNSI